MHNRGSPRLEENRGHRSEREKTEKKGGVKEDEGEEVERKKKGGGKKKIDAGNIRGTR